MALLLAKKLTNQISKLASQQGLPLECELVNFHNPNERKAAGCKGTIRNLGTGKRIIVLSSESCPGELRLELIINPADTYPNGTFSASNQEAAAKIIELLTPPPQEYEILNDSGVSSLPGLSKNPILATYLCDLCTGTEIWGKAKAQLITELRIRGLYTFASSTSYTFSTQDNHSTAEKLRNVLWLEVGGDHQHGDMVYHQLLAYHDVVPSNTAAGRIAYYQDDAKRKAGIRTPIKIRKYLSKFFGKCLDADKLEQVAEKVDAILTTPKEWDVRLFTDDNLDGWSDAYYHVGSCMNTQSTEYGVGELETYRCYCTSAMTDGAKSSGLTLAVLYQGGKPVARAITYEDEYGNKYYVRNYGDDRLVRWLANAGYTHQAWLPNGTHLWTEVYEGDEYLSPYVDGDSDNAKATLRSVAGQRYWVMGSGVVLQNCCGYTCSYNITCEHCGDDISRGDEYNRSDIDGDTVTLCHGCRDDHCHTVDGTDDIYVPDVGDLIETTTQGYFTPEYLYNYDLALTGDGYVMHESDVDLCVHSDEYFSISDFVDLSDAPDFVRDSWAGYINDNDRVLAHLYNRDGTYLEEIDERVHAAHTSAIRRRLETQAS